jgi:signal transduction histidine kinase
MGSVTKGAGQSRRDVQVFQNLLSNALKYRKPEEPPRVQITASLSEGQWQIAVSDNGIGFKMEYAERIFRLFHRLHSNGYPGTGLGLAICKRIVERCGGRIWAQSAPGEGAAIYFSLPG